MRPAKLERLKKREDFLRLRHGKVEKRAGFVIQAAPNNTKTIRVGFTCSKKVGNAVARNRAKRRLRAMADIVLPIYGVSGWDYVFIGRATVTAYRNFEKIQNEAITSLKAIHK